MDDLLCVLGYLLDGTAEALIQFVLDMIVDPLSHLLEFWPVHSRQTRPKQQHFDLQKPKRL